MNKISAFLIGAVSLGMVACDDFDMPNPPAQSNPQEPAIEASTLSMTPYFGAEDIVNLIAVNEAGQQVALARVDSIRNFPAGYEFGFTVQVAATPEFAKVANVPTTVTDSVVYVNPDDLTAAFREVISKSPDARSVSLRFAAYAVKGESRVRLGGTDVYYCPETTTVLPLLPAYTIEEAYYLIGTATDGAISATKAVKMKNNGENPYDDPLFVGELDITNDEAAAGYRWAIVPQSTLDAGSGVVYAPAETTDNAEGVLALGETTGNWVEIKSSGTHLVTFNAEPNEEGTYDYTYAIAIKCLYTPGASNGWNQSASQTLQTTDYKNYSGFVYTAGEFKFTSAPDWDHINYGFAEDGKLSTDGGAGNISANGLFWANVNIETLTYSLSGPLTTMGLRGDATEGGWDTTTQLTPSDDFLVWTGTVKLKGEGNFKFIFNDNWDLCNLGGNISDLTFKGADMPTPGEGTYDVVVDLSVYPYEASFTKK